jgi:EpsI family protein
VVLAVAGAAYAVLDLLEGFIALPLREWSSVIAAGLLRLAGFAVERSGTIISTGRSSFEVVPACSGSTTLQVLFALGIVWCGSHPRLDGWRRALAMALAMPLAVTGNGLRVAVLIALGDVQLQPVEGVLHAAIGVFTFCLALGALLLIAERLATGRSRGWSGGARLAVLASLLAILAIPVAVWCFTAWTTSPLDRFGWALAILAILASWWSWRRLPDGRPRPPLSLTALGIGLAVAIAGVLLEINLLHALGLIGAAAGVCALLRGPRAALVLAPCWLLLGLATPVSGFLLTRAAGITGPAASMALRAALAALCLAGSWLLCRRRIPAASPSHPIPVPALAMAGLALALQVGLLDRGREADRLIVAISYLQGDWVGDDLPVGEQTRLLLGRDHLCTRRYHDSGGRIIDLIVTSTGGDRHHAHPPEYCLTGASWTLTGADTETFAVAGGPPSPVARRRFSHEGQRLTMLYWFTDGSGIRGSYASMLGEDTLRRLRGRRTDWILMRLIGSDEAALDDFAASFRPAIAAPSH